MYQNIRKTCTELLTEVKFVLFGTEAKGSSTTAVWNSFAWPRRVLVAIPATSPHILNNKNTQLIQNGDHHTHQALIPVCAAACSVTEVSATAEISEADFVILHENPAKGIVTLENSFISATFNSHGQMIQLYDKKASRSVLVGRFFHYYYYYYYCYYCYYLSGKW
jgi:hypothetical protein